MSKYSIDITSIRLSDYHYDLPEEKIAQKPLEKRDQSKLLVYQSGEIKHQIFTDLPDHLPKGSLLVFNDTKVIRARLYFRRETGALIEILLLNPESPREVHQAMQVTDSCVWSCMIGRKKKWKDGEILQRVIEVKGKSIAIQAELVDRENNQVKLSWNNLQLTLAQLLEILGELPLPPYISREATVKDDEQYQTVYARQDGAVAAPTAGLHFTEKVLQDLENKGISKEYVTLHVSAGTFLPVKHDQVIDHDMHSEQLIISRENIQRLKEFAGNTIPVGTTSMRVIESLYWLGVKLIQEPKAFQPDAPFKIEKLFPYQHQKDSLPTVNEALEAIEAFFSIHNLQIWTGETEIFI
ncbi:MAG: S-adenosylmethionine:tRNA ribosyltransferase-isomerase, partial [Bacteroidetes bacterium]|nr:S-adenosylmethionine:tRNA ribosyltransferase-isomerase [Bacteroidota bacterium]